MEIHKIQRLLYAKILGLGALDLQILDILAQNYDLDHLPILEDPPEDLLPGPEFQLVPMKLLADSTLDLVFPGKLLEILVKLFRAGRGWLFDLYPDKENRRYYFRILGAYHVFFVETEYPVPPDMEDRYITEFLAHIREKLNKNSHHWIRQDKESPGNFYPFLKTQKGLYV